MDLNNRSIERMDTGSSNTNKTMDNNGGAGNTGTSSGSLRAKISLKGGYSQLAMVCPFYGMKNELPPPSPLLGSVDMINYCDLGGAYNRYCGPKKLPENLSSFLHQICGTSNLNYRNDASCSLRKLVEKPPITGKEILPLSSSAMVGFKLAPGKAENFQLFDSSDSSFNHAMASTPISSNNYGNMTTTTANGTTTTNEPNTSNGPPYNEFLRNFNDPEEEKNKHRKKFKRSLDNLEGENERKIKKHRGDEREKDKNKKEKKKEKKEKKEKKKKKNMEEDSKKRKDVISPFF